MGRRRKAGKSTVVKNHRVDVSHSPVSRTTSASLDYLRQAS